jgi:glyoxylase-like metal-dependent hydrolase (beta-lactamase superfamily II)
LDHLPNSLTLSVGTYEVYVLRDGVYRVPTSHVVHARGKAARQAAVELWGSDEIAFDVNCFALSGPDGLTLIDTGSGDEDGPEGGNAALALRDAGFRPDEVRNVLLTHIHSDHLGGLFDGDRARYPNAIVHVPRGDLEFYVDRPGGVPVWKRNSVRNVARVHALYGDRIRPFDFGPVLPGIDAMALPGHTPGHSGFLIHDDRRSLLIWGDVVHVERLQIADPEVGMDYDIDRAAALHSRQQALRTAAREGWYVAGSHIVGIHRIESADAGFAFIRE